MRILIWTILTIILVLLFAALVLMYSHFGVWSWKEMSSRESPNGEFFVYYYEYSSDLNRHAPYGTYLYLSPRYKKAMPRTGYVIFAGYCTDTVGYQWESNDKLSVNCATEEQSDVRTSSAKAYGITIDLQTDLNKDL